MGMLESIAAIIVGVLVVVACIVFAIVLIPIAIIIGTLAGGLWLIANGYPFLGVLVLLIDLGMIGALKFFSDSDGTHISGWFDSD